MKILTKNHTKPLPEKYAKVVLQVATLEERIRTFMSFGMVNRAKEISQGLIALLEQVKDEFEKGK